MSFEAKADIFFWERSTIMASPIGSPRASATSVSMGGIDPARRKLWMLDKKFSELAKINEEDSWFSNQVHEKVREFDFTKAYKAADYISDKTLRELGRRLIQETISNFSIAGDFPWG
jgi:hypothetical protein